MRLVKILFTSGIFCVLCALSALCADEKRGTLSLDFIGEPKTLRHCETFTMKVIATLKNPPRRGEAKKSDAKWYLTAKAEMVGQNPPPPVQQVCRSVLHTG